MAQRTVPLTNKHSLRRFADLLVERIGACRVLLFGSHARGDARPDSDYDLIIVAPGFANVDVSCRAIGLRALWYEAGGDGPMDLICLTPEEFDQAQNRISLITAVLPEAVDILPEHC